MRRFIIDQLIFLAVGIVFMIFVPFFCGTIFTYVFESIILIAWCYQCRWLILIPIDCLLGKTTQIVYFANECGIHEYEFFKNSYCFEWKVYFSENHTIRLLVPDCTSANHDKVSQPQRDQRIKVIYFKLSKILLNWEPL